MEITGRELLKEWNAKKGVNFSLGSENAPSQRVQELDKAIAREGDCFIDWFTKHLNDVAYTNDVSCVSYLGTDFRTYRKEWETEQAKAGDADVGTLSLLSKELIRLIGSDLATEVEGVIKDRLDAYVQDKVFIKAVRIGDLPIKKVEGVTHEQFETILKFVAMDEPVMLVGPAGSGKNIICKQVADALGLDFYFSNAITQEYQLTGFVDAMGNYQGTQFYDCFTKGGLFLLDEMDASSPDVLIKLNAAIANGYFDFPKFGRIEAHKDFRVIACGNTWGNGASLEYVGRNQLDGASVNRFGQVFVDYDARIEEAVAEGNMKVVEFCREMRRVAEKNGCHLIISYREISRLHKMIDYAQMDERVAIQTCVVKGLEKDTLRMIAQEMKDVDYKKFLIEIINN